jgi:phosphate ABC transporter phosphate-binding protein
MLAPLTVLEFRTRLEKSGLLEPGVIAEFFRRREWRDDAGEPDSAVAESLLAERLITPFQAGQLLKGHTDDFFLTEKYKILNYLGAGGMGKVYLCEHLILRRLVAVKLLRIPEGREGSSPTAAVERFYREARAVATLDHPNVVRVFDVDRKGSDPFMVIEYVDGSDLHALVREHGPLAPDRAAHYIRQAAAGLASAHGAGLIHRDVKPSNVLVDRSGVVKILDLGLARFTQDVSKNQGLTTRFDSNVVLGTVDFMAPEQAVDSSHVDVRTDIYSLGCTFYYLLTGRVPFGEGTIAQKMYAHQHRAPDPVSELCPRLPIGLVEVLERMMAKDPAERYAEANDVVGALAAHAGPIPPPPAAEMPETPASFYRLGLSPTPTNLTSASAHEATPTPASQLTGKDRRPDASDIKTQAITPRPISELSFVVRDGRRVPRAAIGLIAAVGLAIAGIIVWLATRHGSPPSAPAGAPKDDGGAPSTANGGPKDQGVAAPPKKGGPFVGVIVRGGGSTFVNPPMQHWAGVYEKRQGVRIDYQGVGSSKGTQGVIDRVYDFGCSDYALSDAQLAKADGAMIHVPLVMGAVVPTYNLPSVKEQLRFTAPALAGIYLGNITRWNDPALLASNPGVRLPDMPIAVILRADGSGTTFIWTDFLSKASAEWRTKHGAQNLVKIDNALVGQGNAGVADQVSRTIGGIGYVEMTYAQENALRFGLVRNRAGKYVDPNPESVTAAAAQTTFPADLRFTLTDAPGADSYPISGTTWAVIRVDQSQNPSGRELLEFLRWATHEGQAYLKDLRFAPLPPELVKRIDDKLATVKLPARTKS